MGQYCTGRVIQKLASASVPNITAPTFSGISSMVPQASGAMLLGWPAATGSAALPIVYRVYMLAGVQNAATLLASTPIGDFVGLQALAVALGDHSTYLINGTQYSAMVRALSAVNVQDNNTTVITATAIASGNLADIFQSVAEILESAAGTSGRAIPAIQGHLITPDVLTGRIIE